MRGVLAALAACLVLPVLAIPGDAVAGGGSSGTTATAIGTVGTAFGTVGTAFGPSGYYWPVARVRALDSRISGALAAGTTTKVRVTGLGHVPATGVVAISVNLTVLTPAVPGSVSAFADGTYWSGATMSFRAGQTGQNLETVPVGANGLIDLRNNTTRSLTLIVDILGYHTSDGSGLYGLYQPMTPTRLLDTRTGQPVAAGQTRTIQVAGRAGIPPQSHDFPMAAVINFTVLTPSRPGSLTVLYPGEPNTPDISFAAGQTEQGQFVKPLQFGGGVVIRNNSAAAIQVIADLVGYYTGVNYPDSAGFDHVIVRSGPYRLYDSRVRGGAPLPPGGTVELSFQDLLLWNPSSGICAPLLNITVLTPSAAGSVSAWPAGIPWDRAASVSFAAHQTQQRQLMVASGRASNVQIRNNSGAPITLIVDDAGYRTCV
jgi:hypothetical protein